MSTRGDARALPVWAARKVIAHIRRNLPEAVPVRDLARILHYSSSYFHRAFRQRFGIPPHKFVMLHRIRMAKRLLLETNESLSQISLACGMFDQAHFARTFRRVVGDSPGRWRLNRRRRGSCGCAQQIQISQIDEQAGRLPQYEHRVAPMNRVQEDYATGHTQMPGGGGDDTAPLGAPT
jgi:AraC-like DNA-binding protein